MDSANRLPLLRTKLHLPVLKPGHIARPHLCDRLNAALLCRLTLISAPAGYGKTTLLAQWAANHADSARLAWLSLDEADNDPARFLAYLVAALQGTARRIAEDVLPSWGALTTPSVEALLAPLLNDLADATEPVLLMLDDYHVIHAQAVHEMLVFLAEHLSPQVHLVIASRADPPLPLARLRGRGQLIELREADLRFTPPEAAAFLNRSMGLGLSQADISALIARTEGWIAGLQMAAVSLQGREDAAAFIETFSGSNRNILDYLLEEVLQRQPEDVQTFLLCTAVLDRLSGPLCDALVKPLLGEQAGDGWPGSGQDMLERLERANLFIVPLDDERHWYRYHHLFADLLRRRLQQAHPGLVPALHRRASEWCERNGLLEEAVEQALSAADYPRAAHLIAALPAMTLWDRGEQTTLSRWLAALPDDLLRTVPQLGIYDALQLLLTGHLEIAQTRLDSIEEALARASHDDQAPSPVLTELLGMVAAVRAYIARFRGDVPAMVQHSRRALDLIPASNLPWRSSAATTSGDALSMSGETASANAAYAEALQTLHEAGNTYLILMAISKLAINERLRGHLHRTAELCRQGLDLAQTKGLATTALAGALWSTLGEVLYEWNELATAFSYLRRACELGERGGNVAALGWSYMALARALLASGDLQGTGATLDRLESLAHSAALPVWIATALPAWRAGLLTRQGRLAEAVCLFRERGLDAADQVHYLHEGEYLMLARLLLAEGRPDDAVRLLARLREAAESSGRMVTVLAADVLEAIALQAQGQGAQAKAAMQHALSLAEPEGYVRVFIDEGQPMATLLMEELRGRKELRGTGREYRPSAAYLERLLAAFTTVESALTTPPPVPSPPLLELLSEREIEILRLIAEGLSNREIGQRLYLALPTVKWHTGNIYGKLGVKSRTHAVARARSLGLLPAR